MFTRLAIVSSLLALTACMPVFDDKPPTPKLTFDQYQTLPEPVSYADMLCCYQCSV